ncbi:MAG: hypothetical protein IKW81_12520 [Pseudobutyrivibrio sp.]|nr:hypothetical protein [Pseudobutyrivibrio sp.]
MILVNISDVEAKAFQKQLFDETYDFNLDNDVEINPMTHSKELFEKWVDNYNCSAFYEPSYVVARAYQDGVLEESLGLYV